jgi:hypothetical protein
VVEDHTLNNIAETRWRSKRIQVMVEKEDLMVKMALF